MSGIPLPKGTPDNKISGPETVEGAQDFEVACLSWCTAGHKITPILFKYVGEDNLVYTVRDIKVKSAYDRPKAYPYKEYICEASIGGFMREFRLLYFTRDSRWLFRIKRSDV